MAAPEDQGAAYAQFAAEQLQAWQAARASNVQALSRLQQTAALPVALVAVVVTLSSSEEDRAVTHLLLIGAIALVAAVLTATIGLANNRSRLANPNELQSVIDAGWQEDDEVAARHHVVVEQVQQMKDLDSVCVALFAWRRAALTFQCIGLVAVVSGATMLVT